MKKQVSKMDSLWIRACKSLNPSTRLSSVYRRFYLGGEDKSRIAISSILTSIVDEFAPMSLGKYKHEVVQQHDCVVWSSDILDNLEVDILVLSNHLRFLSKDKLESLGYIKPSKWRRL